MKKEIVDYTEGNTSWDKDEQAVIDLSERLAWQKKVNVDENWKRLHHRIRQEKWKVRIWRFSRTAAAILLLPILILSGFLFYQLNQLRSMPTEQVELVAAYGVVSKVTLSDGSEVWLNSGSKLVYPRRFQEGTRQVYLSGEAYFKVESDKSHRFDVRTVDGVTVSAYGTEFNVEAYEEDESIKATLAQGAIQVEQTGLRLEQNLRPGEQAVFSKSKKTMDLHNVNLFVETAWKEGQIVFRRTRMEEVAKRLSRHFNVDIQLRDKEIFDYSYSGSFSTETLAEILSLLEQTAPIRCEIIEPEQQENLGFSKRKVVIRPA